MNYFNLPDGCTPADIDHHMGGDLPAWAEDHLQELHEHEAEILALRQSIDARMQRCSRLPVSPCFADVTEALEEETAHIRRQIENIRTTVEEHEEDAAADRADQQRDMAEFW